MMITSFGRTPVTLATGVGLAAFIFLTLSYTNYAPTSHLEDGLVPVSAALSPVVFALVMMGEASAIEGANAIKTALMYLSRPAEFHIICTQDAITVLEGKFKLFSRPAYDIRVNYYLVDEPSVKARAARSGVGTTYSAGWGGMLKIFMHEILMDVDKAVFFDTDMMFLVDPYLLWRGFDNMTDTQIISFPTIGPKSSSMFICSCVMLLNLEEMRKRNFMSSTYLTDTENALALGNAQTWEEAEIEPGNADFGDQGLFWAIWKRYPQHFMHLSESWDISACRFYWHMTLDTRHDSITEEQQIQDLVESHDFYKDIPEPFPQIFPGIIHFNCKGDAVWQNDQVIGDQAWAPYVAITSSYKWVWLNRGDGSATVTSTTSEATTFYDEVISKNKPE